MFEGIPPSRVCAASVVARALRTCMPVGAVLTGDWVLTTVGGSNRARAQLNNNLVVTQTSHLPSRAHLAACFKWLLHQSANVR